MIEALRAKLEKELPAYSDARLFFARSFPKYLREGPWYPLMVPYVIAVVVVTLLNLILVDGSDEREESKDAAETAVILALGTHTVRAIRCCGVVWGVYCLRWMSKDTGWWPLVSFTMQSWTLMTSRYLLEVVLHDPVHGSLFGDSSLGHAIMRVNEYLRFITLLQNSLVVIVWWLLIGTSRSLYVFHSRASRVPLRRHAGDE